MRRAAAVVVAGSLLVAPVRPAVAATGSSVFTWGNNGFGQLGDGSPTSTERGTPSLVSLADVVDISGGREHVLALKSDGTVEAWGSDQNGAIGNGLPLTNVSTPVSVPGLTDVVDVDDGHYHSLALKSDGTVWGWGQNFLGQLAQGNDASPKASPVQWGSISDATAVYGGRDMTYVLDAAGTLWCSGGNGLECGRADGPAEITDPSPSPGCPTCSRGKVRSRWQVVATTGSPLHRTERSGPGARTTTASSAAATARTVRRRSRSPGSPTSSRWAQAPSTRWRSRPTATSTSGAPAPAVSSGSGRRPTA